MVSANPVIKTVPECMLLLQREQKVGGRVRVSISSKDGVIISADHTKNHLQPPKKVPGLTVCVKAQQRDCIRGNKHEKS